MLRSVASPNAKRQQKSLIEPLRDFVAEIPQPILHRTPRRIRKSAEGAEQFVPEGKHLAVVTVGFAPAARVMDTQSCKEQLQRRIQSAARIERGDLHVTLQNDPAHEPGDGRRKQDAVAILSRRDK